MWTVIKINRKKLNFLKNDLKKKIESETVIYSPKTFIGYKSANKKNKIREIHLLGDYIFCYNKHFDKSNILNKLKFLRGIKHLLIGSINSQKEIKFFIDKCKKSETHDGYITNNFYDLCLKSDYKFLSGPFVDNIFKILEFQKNKLKILVGTIKTTIKKDEIAFRPA